MNRQNWKTGESGMKDLIAILKNNPYPGRGIVVGRHSVLYFIMGRSENSRNRIFVRTDDGIRTEAFDPRKMKDPSLIIYHPVRATTGAIIVTNGDQTDTIAAFLANGKTFEDALRTRQYEPDEPNWTPRISALLKPDGSFEIAILKHQADGCQRNFFCYEGCPEGRGYFISTYESDGNPLPSFTGEPIEVAMPAADEVWAALNTDNKVSLFAVDDQGQMRIWNKNLGD
jgi:IMP cyclohydrolase